MINALNFVLGTLTSTWTWLNSWNFQGVSFAVFLVGFVILDILIMRIFG